MTRPFAALPFRLLPLLLAAACTSPTQPGVAPMDTVSAADTAAAGNTDTASAESPASADASTAMTEETTIPVADLHADFDALYAGLQAAHYDLFARRPKPEFDARFAQMRGALTAPMPRANAELHFQRFVAFGRVAHARIDLPMAHWAAHRAAGGRALPLFLRVQDGRVYVLDELAGVDGLAPGDEVRAIDGTPALDWLRRVGEPVSADTDYLLFAQMENSLPLLAWLALGDVDGVEVTLADGATTRTVHFPARRCDQLVDATHTTTPDSGARIAKMLDGGIAYLHPGPFYDNRTDAQSPWDTTAFTTFVAEAFAGFLAAGATDLLVDLRDNPGGDNSFSDPLLAWFADEPFHFSPGFDIRVSAQTIASNQARIDATPDDSDGVSHALAKLYAGAEPGERVSFPVPLVPPRAESRFTGRVHVLVNRHSYSNAANVAAIVQDYGFGRVLGEATADLASTYGAMEQFTLPRTRIVVGYPKARILRPSGDDAARGVVPDVEFPPAPFGAPTDAVLDEAVRKIVAEHAKPGR